MSSRILAFVVAAAVAAPAVSALAQAKTSGPREVQRLEQKTAQLDTRLRAKTGARERQELQRQQRAIDELIRRLQAGESVSPEEIDALVGDIPIR